MKLPGIAFLEFDVFEEPGGSRIDQKAHFHPRGLAGLLYWYAVLPFHGFVFSGMLKGIVRSAEAKATIDSESGSA